jgi:hypothetical protein
VIPQHHSTAPNHGNVTPLEVQTAKDLHNKQNKDTQKYENVKMTLPDCFLFTVAGKHREAYYMLVIGEPN